MIDYRIIDLETYPHRAHLEYFMTMNSPHSGLTAMVDVTDLKAFCKREGCSFFLAFLHVVALSADSIPQFRQRIHKLSEEELKEPVHSDARREGILHGIEIREYAEGPTSHTESTGDELYCYCSIYHHMPWKEYIEKATVAQKHAREKGTLDEDEGIEAFYFPTCLPWVHYTGCVHATINNTDSNPRFSWGKYETNHNGRLIMPLTVFVHHGLVDGIQMGRFYQNVEKNMQALINGTL